ncbi:MAG: triose-phosphate isomerase, partial [Sphingomonadales bacterium]
RGLLNKTLTNGANMRILFGGSVKTANASELMHAADVGGALIGGAALKAVDFDGIIDAYR